VVAAISPKIEQAEIQRAKRKPTESLDAYDCFLHGMASIHEWTRNANRNALQLFYRAIELDPDFASAYAMATWCYAQRNSSRWVTDRSQEVAEVSRLARKAVELGRDNAVALAWGGYALGYIAGDLDAADIYVDRALKLNPNLAPAWDFRGWLSVFLGEPKTALRRFAHVMRLSPLDSLMPVIRSGAALAHLVAGQYDKASSLAEQVLRERPDLHMALRFAAAGNALAGRCKDAQIEMARLRQIDPLLRVADLKFLTPLRRPEDLARYEEGLRKAGLPD
jgi:tetratricopeptide (TPR) repeat protein